MFPHIQLALDVYKAKDLVMEVGVDDVFLNVILPICRRTAPGGKQSGLDDHEMGLLFLLYCAGDLTTLTVTEFLDLDDPDFRLGHMLLLLDESLEVLQSIEMSERDAGLL